MITITTDRLTIRESSGRDFSRIYAMLLAAAKEEENAGSAVREEMHAGSETAQTAPAGRAVSAQRTPFYAVSQDEDEELEKYLAYIHTVYSVFGFGLMSVVLTESQEVIGWCGLQPIGDEDSPLGRIELGYLIDPACRRRGYAEEACRAILDFAFRRLELDEVYAVIAERNEASLCLARKLGFSGMKKDLWVLERSCFGNGSGQTETG